MAVDSKGDNTGHVIDFGKITDGCRQRNLLIPFVAHMERQEMCTMTRASEIANNVWLGPSPDPSIPFTGKDASKFDVLIEAADGAQLPDAKALKRVAARSDASPQSMEFPSSGSLSVPTWSHSDVDSLMSMCKWMYEMTNPENDDQVESPVLATQMDEDGDIQMLPLQPRGKKILIHCADGYTESSLLALTYFMFAECLPVHDAWIRMHCEKQRNFFAYATDMALLKSIQPRIMQESPKGDGAITSELPQEPEWLARLDGSLPSRLLPYLYLGNLAHANNPELLVAMGIRRILSVGEPIRWTQDQISSWGQENLLYIEKVQDNGCDSLTEEFGRSLDFIRKCLASSRS